MADDSELLLRYASENSDEAFAELVRRHLNLVYGTALRQTGGDVALAQEVTQDVFAKLARQAPALVRHPLLSAWLHRCTRFTAIDAVRERTRRNRLAEEAWRLQAAGQGPDDGAPWEKLRPVLDETLEKLGAADRHAVLLRFFEARSFAEVGERLKLSENAARMRVERALDKLRALLAKRGLSSTSAALAAVLADQVAVAAPAGLAATVTQGALTGATVAAGAGFSGLLSLMLTTKNILLGTALILAIAGGLYRGAAIRRQNLELADLREASAAQRAELNRERAERRAEQARPTPAPAAAPETPGATKFGSYSTRLDRLITRLAQAPGQEIPEMRLLDEDDWIAALLHQPLETEDDYRKALGTLRFLAKQHFGKTVQQALSKYRKAMPGQMPTEMAQLVPYFDAPPAEDMLQRYEIQASPGRSGGPAIRDRLASIVDDKYDHMIRVGADGGLGWSTTDDSIAFTYAMDAADQAFRAAHNGAKPADPADITPYFANPSDGQKYSEMIERYRKKTN